MMRSVVGVVVGGALALAIACGGAAKSGVTSKPGPPPTGVDGGITDPRAELDRLDQEITSQMQQLTEPRPAPAADLCVTNCGRQPMAGAAQKAIEPADPTCKPAKTETCTESCNLKSSICDNASRICTIAADLGGNDAYANEKCNRGLASCEAAKKRCCSCM